MRGLIDRTIIGWRFKIIAAIDSRLEISSETGEPVPGFLLFFYDFGDCDGNGQPDTLRVNDECAPLESSDQSIESLVVPFSEVTVQPGETGTTLTLPLPEAIPLGDVSRVVVDSLLIGSEPEAGVAFPILLGVELLDGNLDAATILATGVPETPIGGSEPATTNLQQTIRVEPPSDGVAERLRLHLKLFAEDPDAFGYLTPHPDLGGVRLHVMRGRAGVPSRTMFLRAPPEVLEQEGETPWSEVLFADQGLEPMDGYGLGLVGNRDLPLVGADPSSSVIAELILDDDSPENRSTLRLDDAFIPSRGEPRAGVIQRGNWRLLDSEERHRLADRQIIGWRFKLVAATGGDIAVGVVGQDEFEVGLDFYYDFSDCDRDGTLDAFESGPPCDDRFLRGDCNDDGAVDISDAVSTLGALFLGEGDPGCDDACDSNDDGTVDISDAIATLGVLFLGNGVIPLPGMTGCGVDPTDDDVGCGEYNGCT